MPSVGEGHACQTSPGTESGVCRSPLPLLPSGVLPSTPSAAGHHSLVRALHKYHSPVRLLAPSSTASPPRLPVAALNRLSAAVGEARPPRFRRIPFVHDVALDPGRATGPRIAAPQILPSAPLTTSASAAWPFRGSIPHPARLLCTLRRGRRRTQRNTRYRAGATPYRRETFLVRRLRQQNRVNT